MYYYLRQTAHTKLFSIPWEKRAADAGIEDRENLKSTAKLYSASVHAAAWNAASC